MTDEPTATPPERWAAIRQQWLDEARQTGEADSFASKRGHARYTWREQLDLVVQLPGGRTEEYIATARDISESGLMVFCRSEIDPSQHGEVSQSGTGEAVPVITRHCTQTLGGFLIGLDFVWEEEES